jgi:methylated-DNA-[protein]-cysteine S-methyltransferase
MVAQGFALFDTAIGRCGIAWSERGVVGVQLPEARPAATRVRLLKRFPGAAEAEPPRAVAGAVEDIARLLRGEPAQLSAIELDMSAVPEFHRNVYQAARAIGPGKTLSYGELASKLGAPGLARAVGQALGRNPFAIIVPCHRVLAADGKLGSFSANGGVTTKLKLLALEAGRADRQPGLFAGDAAYGFEVDAALAHLREVDAVLGAAIDSLGPFEMELKRTPSIFVALAEAIVYQQLNGRAAASIYARVCALFPRPHEGPSAEKILRTSDAKLRGAGLSRAKVLALQDLARRAKAGEIPSLSDVQKLPDEEIVERLTVVRGIGRWTVEMLLIFRLARPDVLPVDDFGIRKGYQLLFKKREMPSAKQLAALGEKWAPYRTVASWYLWRAASPSARPVA